MTEILATICGGTTWDTTTIERAIDIGVKAFRVTPTFRSRGDNLEIVSKLRRAAQSRRSDISIYYDCSRGSKIRTCNDRPKLLFVGRSIKLGHRPHCDIRSERPLPDAIAPGTTVYIGDSEVTLRIDNQHADYYICTVTSGGEVRARKGISVKGVRLGTGAVNKDNIPDLQLAAERHLSHVILSFVDGPNDIERCRSLIPANVKIVAKIETRSALTNIDAIAALADEVMVARGDLALQCDYERLALYQWRIAAAAKRTGCPFIIATQLLESVISRLVPMRSDIIDVSSAVLLGAHAIMLGPETCMNPDAIRALETARRIIDAVESEMPTLQAPGFIGARASV